MKPVISEIKPHIETSPLNLHKKHKKSFYRNISFTFTNKNNMRLLSSAFIVLSSVASVVSAETTSEKKNILFIAIDDMKPLLGCYGDQIAQTPVMDKLASQGALFTNAYCQQAVSGPSRASLLTGMCPDNTKVWDLKTLIRSKNPNVVTLPQYFKEHGYHVVGIGKIFDPRSVDSRKDIISWSDNFMDEEPFLNTKYGKPIMAHYQGDEIRALYKKYLEEAKSKGLKNKKAEQYAFKYIKMTTECANVPDNAYLDGATAEGAVQFIADYKSDKPLFLAVGFKKPHLPFCAPKKYWDMYERNNMPLAEYRKKAQGSPDFAYHKCGELQSYSDIPELISFSDIDNVILPENKQRELIHGYYACISYTDAQIGKVINALEKKGILKNTIIVLWGDHGWHLGDHGLWNKHTNFEHATHVPMIIIDPSSRHHKISHPVEFLDIYPTLCELTGLPIPSHTDGQSLASVIKGKKKETVLKPYAASQYPRVNKMGYSIRDGRYRYTIWVDWKNKNTNPDKIYAEELYDYEKDPNETVNLISDKKYSKAIEQMRKYWEDYKKDRIK